MEDEIHVDSVDSERVAAGEGPAEAPGRSAAGVAAGAEGEAGGEAPARAFGLPARLRVAALARRRERTLKARSDRYLYTLYTVGLFYLLPVVQFVVAFQVVST